MKKNYLVTIVLALLAQLGFSGTEFSRFDEFPKRKLLIVLFEENPTKIAELSKNGKPDDVAKYKSNIAKYNENVKFAFSQYWGDKPQEFMVQSKVESLKNEELVNYVVITSLTTTKEGVEFFEFTLNMVYAQINKKGVATYLIDERAFNANVQNEVPSKADLLFLITRWKMYFDLMPEFDREHLEEVLAKKTLLLNKESVQMTESEIKEDYQFPFKLATSEEIFELAEKNDPNSVYLKLELDAKNIINFMIIECETGKILARTIISGIAKVSLNMPSEHATNMANAETARREHRVYAGPSGGAFVGPEIARLYTAKAKLKGMQLKQLSSKKKQLMFYKDLVIY